MNFKKYNGIKRLALLLVSLSVTGIAHAQVFTNDAKIAADYQKSVDSLLLKVKTVTLEDAKLMLANPSKATTVGIVKPSKKVLTANAIYERAKGATVITGCVYLCPRCSNAHISESSGYIIDPKGIMVTNYHVIAQYANMTDGNKPLGFVVRMANGRTYAVKSVLTSSKENDLAVLQLETNGDVLPALPLAEGAKVGEKVFVLGHPKGMHYFFSQGNVMDKYLEEAGEPNKKFFREMVVISADYATGSSGGPVMNEYGDVVATVSNTHPLIHSEMNPGLQMVLKNTVPVESLYKLIKP
ncbi:S1 family peptidase [Pedobacter sp. WC2501]|uniref:S1 family peptidase n=1 Tax=Pedobacter sp. WC2501 TaxID=3461400 RepID=UPI0040455663